MVSFRKRRGLIVLRLNSLFGLIWDPTLLEKRHKTETLSNLNKNYHFTNKDEGKIERVRKD